MNFLILLFAHLLADHPLQGQFLATEKAGKNDKYYLILLSHAGIWAGCIALAGYLIGYDVNEFDVIFLFIVHAILDLLKAGNVGIYKKLDPLSSGLLLDQSLHVLQIIVFIAFAGNEAIETVGIIVFGLGMYFMGLGFRQLINQDND